MFSFTLASQNAAEYLETIGKEFGHIQKSTWEYTRSAAHGKSARKVEKKRKELILANMDGIRRITRLKPFNGNTGLRDSALSYLKVNYAVLNEDYARLVNMEEVAEQSYDAMEAYMLAKQEANARLKEAGLMIDREYNTFASQFNIRLVNNEDRLARNMEAAGEVYRYYNEVYLVFFKSHKQEAYMLEAMEKNDVNGLEQNRNALSRTSSAGIEKLKEIGAFKSDLTLSNACAALLEFYGTEAGAGHGLVTDFYVTHDNFEKLKSGFNAMPESQRKPGDTERYNSAVKEYNQALAAFNKNNEHLNKTREALTIEWNKTCERFTDRHIPKR